MGCGGSVILKVSIPFNICLLFLALVPSVSEAQAELSPSIHQQELAQWNHQEQEGWVPWRDPQNIPVSPLGMGGREISHQVHGYHPYWAGSAYQQYDWSLLTTVAFFGLELGPDGTITNNHGWPWTGLVSVAHDHGTRLIVTVTNFSSSELHTLLANTTFRTIAVANIVSAVQLGGADGVNIDFENLPLTERNTFVLFVTELAAELADILENPYLSVATPAVDWAGSYKYAELASHCDHLMVMGYNYHYPGSPTSGPVAPLTGWGTFNVTWTVDDYLYWGAPPSSILLGVPYYGYRWPTATNNPASETTASGQATTFQTAYPEGLDHGLIWDAQGQTNWYPYYTDQWYQVWFEEQESLSMKYNFVKEQSLAGIGIWALSYDGDRPELWSALSVAFHENSAVPNNPSSEISILRVTAPTPNPTSSETRIHFWLGKQSSLSIRVYDLQGRQVASLASGSRPAGDGEVTWNPAGLASGTYFVCFNTPKEKLTQRVVWVR